MEQILADSYRPRDPQTNDYYPCTQDHFERIEFEVSIPIFNMLYLYCS